MTAWKIKIAKWYIAKYYVRLPNLDYQILDGFYMSQIFCKSVKFVPKYTLLKFNSDTMLQSLCPLQRRGVYCFDNVSQRSRLWGHMCSCIDIVRTQWINCQMNIYATYLYTLYLFWRCLKYRFIHFNQVVIFAAVLILHIFL